MTIDRQQVNFEGNERVDLDDFLKTFLNVGSDFQRFIRMLADDSTTAPRVLKPYVQGTHVGLTFKIATDVPRAFWDPAKEWVFKAADTAGTTVDLTMAPSSVNYVEVVVRKFTDNPQSRKFWDVEIGLSGEEFPDTINVRSRVEEQFQSNTTGYTAGATPLFTVTTTGSAIASVVPAGDLLWKARAFSLPAANVRSTLYTSLVDLRSFIDALGALTSEIKGTSQSFESAPWSSLKLLREYQNMAVTSEILVTFGRTFGAGNVNFSNAFNVDVSGRPSLPYQVAAGTYALADGQALYITLPEGVPGGPITPVAAALASVPINPATSGDPKIIVLYIRRGSTIYGLGGLPSLDIDSSVTTGALGLAKEATVLTVLGNDTYTFPFTFDPGNDILDIQLWMDTGYIRLDPTGVDGFMKTSSNSIKLPEVASISGKELTLRRAGVNTGGGIGSPTVTTKVASKTTAGVQVFTHGVGVLPHALFASYDDGVTVVPIDPTSVVSDMTTTTITVNSGVLAMGAGQTLRVFAHFNQTTSAMT